MSDGLSCINPPQAAGAAPVAPVAPVMESISRDIGIAAGGTKQTIRGYGLTGTTGVTFNAVAATSVVVVSDNVVTCLTPAGTASETAVDVVITNSAGSSTLSAAFEYGAVETTSYASMADAQLIAAGFGGLTNTGSNTIVAVPSARGSATKAVLCTTSVSADSPHDLEITLTNNPPLNQTNGLWVRWFELVPSATVALLITNGQIKHFLGRISGGGGQGTMMLGGGIEFTGSGSQVVSDIDTGITPFLGTVNGGLLGDGNWNEIGMQLTRNSGASTGRCRGWRNGKFVFSITSSTIGSNGSTDAPLIQMGLVYTQNAAAGTLQLYVTDAQVSNGYLEPLDP